VIKRGFWLLTFIVCVYAAWSAMRTGGHDFPEDWCKNCHTFAPVKGDSRSRMMNAPVSTLCGRCHDRAKNLFSHPVEMTPTGVELPADLPLSWDGKFTCSTCHDVHSSPPSVWEGTWKYLRRLVVGRAFCEACHRRGVVGPSGHAQVLTAAHMVFDGKGMERVDNISLLCLSCHDGSVGKSVQVRTGSFRHGFRPEDSAQELSHPVGVNYRRAMMKRGGLHPPEKIDKRIMLVNGRVSCVSCHDMSSREHNLLTVPIQGSKLCLECHDK